MGSHRLARVVMAITISPDTEHGSWVREAVAHFERPLAIYTSRGAE